MLSVPLPPCAATGAAFTRSPSLPPPPTLNGLRSEWRRLARRLAEGDVELDISTTLALVPTYRRFQKAGGKVDMMAAALIEMLAHQLADHQGNSDC